MEKTVFDLWNNKELPERIQEEVDGFAKATNKSNAEQIFRAGFIIGLNNKKYKEEMGIAK